MGYTQPIEDVRGKISFALYLYPFEATNIAPSRGGDNVDEVIVEGEGIEIAQRGYPKSWKMVCEDQLWWISLDRSWLNYVGLQIPSNATQYELEFLVTTINLCVDPNIFFTRFARREYVGIIEDGRQSRPSNAHEFVQVLARPIPDTIIVDGDQCSRVISRLLNDVLPDDGNTDLSKAFESYRAAIQSFNTEVHARLLYSVCENALFIGNPPPHEKDQKISDVSDMERKEAQAWRHLVNRTKHPDEGTPYSWEDTFQDVPPPVEIRMREAANKALLRGILAE